MKRQRVTVPGVPCRCSAEPPPEKQIFWSLPSGRDQAMPFVTNRQSVMSACFMLVSHTAALPAYVEAFKSIALPANVQFVQTSFAVPEPLMARPPSL